MIYVVRPAGLGFEPKPNPAGAYTQREYKAENFERGFFVEFNSDEM